MLLPMVCTLIINLQPTSHDLLFLFMKKSIKKTQRVSEEVKTFRKLFHKKYSSDRLSSLADKNYIIAHGKNVDPQQINKGKSGSLLPKLHQLETIAIDKDKKQRNREMFSNMDMYLATKTIKKQEQHSAVFLTQSNPITPDYVLKDKFDNFVKNKQNQTGKVLMGMLSMVSYQGPSTSERRNVLRQQAQELRGITKQLILENKDIAFEEKAQIEEDYVTKSINDFGNQRSQKKVLDEVVKEAQKKFIIRKQQSLGKLTQTY